MKKITQRLNNAKMKLALLSTTAVAASNSAMAQVDTSSITAAQADITTVGGLIVATAGIVFGIRWVKAMFF